MSSKRIKSLENVSRNNVAIALFEEESLQRNHVISLINDMYDNREFETHFGELMEQAALVMNTSGDAKANAKLIKSIKLYNKEKEEFGEDFDPEYEFGLKTKIVNDFLEALGKHTTSLVKERRKYIDDSRKKNTLVRPSITMRLKEKFKSKNDEEEDESTN